MPHKALSPDTHHLKNTMTPEISGASASQGTVRPQAVNMKKIGK